MKRSFPALLVALAALAVPLARPTPAYAQLDVTATCTAFDVSGCTMLDFMLGTGSTPVALTSLELTFLTSGWVFTSALFEADDDFGPFFGTGTLGSGGASIFLNFVSDPGFAFELGGNRTGFLSFAASGPGTAEFIWSMMDPSGASFDGEGSIGADAGDPTVTPEPATLLLLGTGLGALVGARRRRGLTRGDALTTGDALTRLA